MASKSKIKGNTYERELVNYFIDQGFVSERARGSDGRSLGMDEDVDGYIESPDGGIKIKWQAKEEGLYLNGLIVGIVILLWCEKTGEIVM